MAFSSKGLKRALVLSVVAAGLGGCVAYPAPGYYYNYNYGYYGSGYYPYYYGPPAYGYGPPVYGGVVIGGGGRFRHWR